MALMNQPMNIRDKLLLFLSLFRQRRRILAFFRFHMLQSTKVFQNLSSSTIGCGLNKLNHFLDATTHRFDFHIEIMWLRHGHVCNFLIFLEKL